MKMTRLLLMNTIKNTARLRWRFGGMLPGKHYERKSVLLYILFKNFLNIDSIEKKMIL